MASELSKWVASYCEDKQMRRARVVAALVDLKAYDGRYVAVGPARIASELTWQEFDQAALELAERAAVKLGAGHSMTPIVDNSGKSYSLITLC